MNANENVLCVLRDRLDFTEAYKDREVIDIEKEPSKVILSELDGSIRVDDRFVDITRGEAEYNKKYIQIVVGLILKCKEKYVFMRCKDGIMNGNTTLIQGHVNVKKGNVSDYFLKSELCREVYEEISMDNLIFAPLDVLDIIAYGLKLKYITYNSYDEESVSYYHYGFIYEYDMGSEFYRFFDTSYLISKEPEKNSVIIVNRDHLKELDNPDGWVREMIYLDNF